MKILMMLCLLWWHAPSILPITGIEGAPIYAPSLDNLLADGEPMIMLEDIAVCSSSSSKSYMDYTKISDTSRQGRFIAENMTIKDGLLYDKYGFIGVALGSYFGPIGSRYIFTLDNGTQLRLIKVEHKSNSHTINGCWQKDDYSVIEFVIDTKTNIFPYFSNKYIANGNFNNLEQFRGKIKSIVKVLDN